MSTAESQAPGLDAPFFGDLSRFEFKTEYRSLKEDPATTFYRPCLLNSNVYKRAAGYFRSSVFLVIGPSVIEFARRGGKISLICSPELDPNDIDGIAAGYGRRSEIVEQRLIEEIDRLLAEEKTSYRAQILATLISVSALDIKIALRSDRKGIYHEKIGIFRDGLGNRVSFKGSANETWSGWHADGNFESIEVFCSWRAGLEEERVRKHEAHFDSLWSGQDSDIDVFSFPEKAIEHLKRASLKGLDAVENVPIEHLGTKRQALPHQAAAIDAWEARGSRGIFEHATGSGKTFTAILAIRKQIERGRPAIVLVPSRLLLEQWANELRVEVPHGVLLKAGAGNNAWKKSNRLRSMTANEPNLGGRIVLVTMQTAASDHFLANIVAGDHLLVVADEVHQIGSPQNSRFLDVNAGSKLGLSATPTRYGDPVGTQRILSYFGGLVPPPISLVDAIRAGRLVEYEYFPHPINLTASESDAWKELSQEIRLEIAKQKADSDGKKLVSERAKLLLIKRSRIAKKATNKIALATHIITREFRDGQHWLVYCEDSNQLGQILAEIRSHGFNPIEYHSSMDGDSDATMAWFKTFGGILVSIRCLDEGVDIPAVSHALILASSQNPRQFIQRRGRVLRKIPGKSLAVIHDAIVVPINLENEPDQSSLLKSELLRAIEFSRNAINKTAGAELRDIAINLGLSPDELSDAGIEEDEEQDDA